MHHTSDTIADRHRAFAALVHDLDAHTVWYQQGLDAGQHHNWIHTGHVTNTARRLTGQKHLTYESIPLRLTTDQIQSLHSIIKKRITKVQSRAL